LNTEGASIRESIDTITLRPVRLADASDLARIYRENKAFMARYDPPRNDSFFTEEGQRVELEQAVAQAAVGARFRYVILDGDEVVGMISMSNLVRGPFQSANLGYWVAEQHNGRGVGTRAVALVIEAAFQEHGLHRLEAGTLLDNVASQRVLRKNGFEEIGIAPRYLFIAGDWRDHLLFQRLSDD
jgi:ribosomal-protein-alanine N-acetyltransferase